jgi:hypothetical protein
MAEANPFAYDQPQQCVIQDTWAVIDGTAPDQMYEDLADSVDAIRHDQGQGLVAACISCQSCRAAAQIKLDAVGFSSITFDKAGTCEEGRAADASALTQLVETIITRDTNLEAAELFAQLDTDY